MATPPFPKLLEGVVLALSGFVNPERGELRSHAMEMGAQFRPDWGSDCTLLVCAFPNTPKFRQVHADSGTIVSKEWIVECYSKKRLVEIEPYLMNPGKPWRRKPVNSLVGAKQEYGQRKDTEQQIKKAHSKPTLSSSSKGALTSEDIFPSSEVKKWVTSDLSNTVSWLQSQEEKPEPDEVKKIAAEGIITCLQDAVEALENSKDIRDVMDQWMFVPRVVEELAKHGESRARPMPKKELVRLATHCKQIYTDGLRNLENSAANKKVKRMSGSMEELQDQHVADDPGSDSDATIVMTEEEIEQAWRGL